MPTYIYTTVVKEGEEPVEFEVVQSMRDKPLTKHPETGQPVRRVLTGGIGFNMNGDKIDPFSQKQFRERTGQKGDTLGALFDRSAELSQMRAEKTGMDDPVRESFFSSFQKSRRGTPHPAKLAQEQKKAQKKLNDSLNKVAKELGLD